MSHSSALMGDLLAVEVLTRRWQSELVIGRFRGSGENPLFVRHILIAFQISR